MPADYIQCLVCGRLTPTNRGICYHCHSPLPSRILLPPGNIVCPNCLKVTPTDTGYCRHCRAPLPIPPVEPRLVPGSSIQRVEGLEGQEKSGGVGEPPARPGVPGQVLRASRPYGVIEPGAFGRVLGPGPLPRGRRVRDER